MFCSLHLQDSSNGFPSNRGMFIFGFFMFLVTERLRIRTTSALANITVYWSLLLEVFTIKLHFETATIWYIAFEWTTNPVYRQHEGCCSRNDRVWQSVFECNLFLNTIVRHFALDLTTIWKAVSKRSSCVQTSLWLVQILRCQWRIFTGAFEFRTSDGWERQSMNITQWLTLGYFGGYHQGRYHWNPGWIFIFNWAVPNGYILLISSYRFHAVRRLATAVLAARRLKFSNRIYRVSWSFSCLAKQQNVKTD